MTVRILQYSETLRYTNSLLLEQLLIVMEVGWFRLFV